VSVAVTISETVETQPFWEGCRRHELRIQRCTDCGKHQFYPRVFCVVCSGRNLAWIRASGRATVTSYTIVRSGSPYVVALVILHEGPSMMTNIVGCEFSELKIGMPVTVVFEDRDDGYTLPKFTP
jgi:uncharacterized protein